MRDPRSRKSSVSFVNFLIKLNNARRGVFAPLIDWRQQHGDRLIGSAH
jgi:hypothetical protein